MKQTKTIINKRCTDLPLSCLILTKIGACAYYEILLRSGSALASPLLAASLIFLNNFVFRVTFIGVKFARAASNKGGEIS